VPTPFRNDTRWLVNSRCTSAMTSLNNVIDVERHLLNIALVSRAPGRAGSPRFALMPSLMDPFHRAARCGEVGSFVVFDEATEGP